ncbi:MAG: substrate-binding domain-containing protein, partial [Spirochaetota bacterium]
EARRSNAASLIFYDRADALPNFIDSGEYRDYTAVIGSIPSNDTESTAAWHRLETLVPCVTMMSEPHVQSAERNYVGCDEKTGIALLVDHLIEEGAERIAFCSYGCDSYTHRRCQGFVRALGHHHREIDQRLVNAFDVHRGAILSSHRARTEAGTDRTAYRREIYRSLLKEKPDACVCDSDQLAVELNEEAQARGLSVPGDIMIAGFNNSPVALGKKPFITSVDQNLGRIARTALRLVFDIVNGRAPRYGNEILITPRVIIRNSTLRRSVLVNTRSDKALMRAMNELIAKHFSDRAAASVMASRLGLTPPYFLKRYKALFGTPFTRAVNDMRLAKAAVSLKTTNKSITHIFMENGYTNHVHFNKLFKRAFGRTAKEYRRTYKKKR